MVHFLRRFAQPPHFDDEEQTRIAQTQHLLLVVCLTIALFAAGANALLQRPIPTTALLSCSGVLFISFLLLQTRRVRLSIIVLLGTIIMLTASLQFIGHGAHDTVTSLYATMIVIGSLLLDRRSFIGLVVATLLVIAGIVTAEARGLTRSPYEGDFGDWFDLALILGLTAFTSRLLSESLERSRARARANEQALAQQTEALRLSEERYRILAANLPDSAVLIFDHNLRYVLADGPELAATGYLKEKIEGRTLYEVVSSSFAEQVEGNIRAVLSGRRFSAELPFRDRIYVCHYIPLIDDCGAVKYAMVLLHNVTAQRQAEANLRASEAQLRMLAENMGDAIMQLDSHLNVVYVSPSVRRVLECEPEDVAGKHIAALVSPDDAPAVATAIEEARESGASAIRVEYRFRNSQQMCIWLESEIRLLYDAQQRFEGAILSTRDVTRRKEVEAERERLIAELEQKNAELERFTYTVSHDLKSPLITIQGFLGYLEQDIRNGDTDRALSDIRRISAAARRMEHLLRDLLELSRIGRVSAEPQTVPFNMIVQDALELIAGRIAERQARITVAPDMPAVYGDRRRLAEVVQNLVDNAIKFCDNQTVPEIEIGVHAVSDNDVVFFVRDNGVGIDPRYHDQIFGLFNKLDPQSEGTGVGLTIVRRITEVHGGRVWVESAGRGAGATFFFSLPTTHTQQHGVGHDRQRIQSIAGGR
ncbi:MAG: PAS domain-containing protein [Roseiflexus sp.]|jgi:PAS domain S-box-containing protein|nr:PAS domain-containing protein [Roseiflexus sp.]MBO9333685.1 PAS domain-containing protein [Roseiflexus sp.]MBO9363541.1 PAS domain-containing protein [Roseiflexus sp.]MBO9387775.1 PAS domain-containing protein [Roseiflexus sp.]